VEPAACALHAACAAQLVGGEQVAVIGAGSVGLLVVAALAAFALGAWLLYQAFEARGRPRPFVFRLLAIP